jgi:AcrR family transcriptional regulator
VDVIAQDGWEGVTIRKVTAAAGVSVALVNYHFGSKANLMSAALEFALDQEVVTPAAEALQSAAPDRVIEELVRVTLEPETSSSARRVFDAALGAVARDPELAARLRPMLDRFRALLADVFRRAASAGRLPAEADPDALAIVFMAMLDGLWLQRMIDPDLPVDRVSSTAGALLRSPSNR